MLREQRQAIHSHPDEFTRVEDNQTRKAYLIIEETRAAIRYDQWLREQLQAGFDQADCGGLAHWSLEEFLAPRRQSPQDEDSMTRTRRNC